MAEQVKIDIYADASSIKELKQQLLEARTQLAGMDASSENFSKVAQRAGEIKDQMKDINEQVAIFAGGSKFEQAGVALGQVKDALFSLDFQGAAEKAKSLTSIIKGISFGEATKGLGQLGSTFLSLGKALLTNPLFLIPAAIIAILDAFGLLKPIIEAVMGVFKIIGDAVKDFLTSLGLVTAEVENNDEAQKKLNDTLRQQAEYVSALNDSYAEYRSLIATGGELDIKKQLIAAENTLTDILRNRPKDFEAIKNAQQNINALNTKLVQEQSKARLDAFDEQQRVNKARIDEINEELNRNKGVTDAEKARAKEIFNERQKLINDTLTVDVRRNNIIKENEVNLFKVQTDNANKIQDINKKIADDKKKAYDDEQLMLKKMNEDELKALNISDKNKMDAANNWLNTLEQIQEQNYLNSLGEQGKEIQMVKDKYFELETLAGDDIEAQKIIAEAKAFELGQINDKYRNDELEKDKEFKEAQIQAEQDLYDAKWKFANAIIDAGIQLAGKNKKLADALFLVQKGLAIAQIVVDTAKSIASVNAGIAAIPAILPPGIPNPAFAAAVAAGAAQKNSLRLTAAAQIATIAASSVSRFMNGGGSTGGNDSATPNTGTVTTPAQPAFQLIGQANQGNVVNAATGNNAQTINVNASVSVEQITDTQKKLVQIKQSKTL